MTKNFVSYLGYLTLSGASETQIATAQNVFRAYQEWASAGSLPELQVARTRLAGALGTEGDGYVTVSDINALTAGMQKRTVQWAMTRLGFRAERMYIDGVQTRVWARGVAKTPLRVIPPCPVPAPMGITPG